PNDLLVKVSLRVARLRVHSPAASHARRGRLASRQPVQPRHPRVDLRRRNATEALWRQAAIPGDENWWQTTGGPWATSCSVWRGEPGTAADAGAARMARLSPAPSG